MAYERSNISLDTKPLECINVRTPSSQNLCIFKRKFPFPILYYNVKKVNQDCGVGCTVNQQDDYDNEC